MRLLITFFLFLSTNVYGNKWILPDHPNLSWKEQAPNWVAEVEIPKTAPSSQIEVQTLLVDRQFDLERGEKYFHVVSRVLEGGVQGCSRFEIPFDPSYQHVHIHKISVIRNGICVDSPLSKEARLIQREEALESHVYQGTLTLIFFLHNVRVGDIIETSYTLIGDNPNDGMHFCANWPLAFSFTVEKLFFRLLYPKNQPLFFKFHNCEGQITTSPASETHLESIFECAPTEIYKENYTPIWFQGNPWLQASTFASWQEVQEWAYKLYNADLHAESIHNLSLELKSGTESDEAFLLKALEYVQNEIRYLGMEEGVYCCRPHQPEEVLHCGYGDCKDKTLLLMALLKGAGFEVYPSLVSSSFRQGILNWHPSFSAFDHVILKVCHQGEEYWLDPTAQYEKGDLKQRSKGFYTAYLELLGNAAGLTEKETLFPPNQIESTAHFTLHKDSAELHVTTYYKGIVANELRGDLAIQGEKNISENFLKYFTSLYDTVETLEAAQFVDDPVENVIAVAESYRINKDLAQENDLGILNLSTSYLHYYLPQGFDPKQTEPYPLYHPIQVSETILLTLPTQVPAEVHENEKIETDAFRYYYEREETGNRAQFKLTYTSLDDHVKPEELATLQDHIGKMEANLFTNYMFFLPLEGSPYRNFLHFALGFLVKVACSVAIICLFRAKTDKSIRRRWKIGFYLVCTFNSLLILSLFAGKLPDVEAFLFLLMLLVFYLFQLFFYIRAYKKHKRLLLGLQIAGISSTLLSLYFTPWETLPQFLGSLLALALLLMLQIIDIQLFNYNSRISRKSKTPQPAPA